MRAEFNAAALDGVEKIVLENNEFGVKHRILRAERERKFLLYRAGPPPADLDNWLLDVQLAHAEFHADQAALWLVELGLAQEMRDVVEAHAEFFRDKERRDKLRKLLAADDSPRQVRLKLLAVCTRAEPRQEEILEHLLAELAQQRDEAMKLIRRSALDAFLWEQMAREFGYTSSTPTLRDFVIQLFQWAYRRELGEETRSAGLSNDALVFLRRWKDSTRWRDSFESLSHECAEYLAIEQDLQTRDYRTVLDLDLFEVIEPRILSGLVRDVGTPAMTAAQCEQIVRRRRETHWFDRYRPIYEAALAAAQFVHALDTVQVQMRSLTEGVQQYARSWYVLDQLYRKFVLALRQASQPTLLAPLAEQVENLYVNRYLFALNNQWQPLVDACARWEAEPVRSQATFFEQQVRPVVQRGNKVCVVISDAMRYEVGEELLRLMRQEDRFEAALEPLLSVLPSYTQLGMAALLPHKTLALANDAADSVLVDGQSSQGMENRRKLLDKAPGMRAHALRADELLKLGKEESRALVRDYDVVYVYHNRIDLTGDEREEEERVFEAVEDALDEMVRIVKKLTNANANNVLVTADHGFLFQQRALDESDFATEEPVGAQIAARNRRFVLGTGLQPSPAFKHFRAEQVGLEGATEMLLPKSINRLRVKGSGTRYVHGGATLQEVVVPLVKINKKRGSDLKNVDVEILRGSTSTITAGQFTVTFYQTAPVTEKLQAVTLRAGLYTERGDLISDMHELSFDSTAESPAARERRVQFVLTKKADAANNREVILRLEELVPETSHYKTYKETRYTLRRSFTSDFDF